MPKQEAPVVNATKDGRGHLIFWCSYCDQPHIHGAEEGPRVAHCYKPTPYTETGYVLKEENDATD